MQWHPIETAPQDNKRMLLLARFNPDTGELQELDFDGCWHSESESWELPEVYWYWASANGRVEEPTHWAYQDDEPAEPVAWQVRVFFQHEGRPHLDHWSRWHGIKRDAYEAAKASGTYWEYSKIELRTLVPQP